MKYHTRRSSLTVSLMALLVPALVAFWDNALGRLQKLLHGEFLAESVFFLFKLLLFLRAAESMSHTYTLSYWVCHIGYII